MTPRENALRILQHEKGEWLPDGLDVIEHISSPVYERPMTRTAKDAFGVKWLYSGISGFGCHYDSKQTPVITDLARWSKQLVPPNLDIIDWERIERQYAGGPNEKTVWDVPILMGPLERISVLMPFEEALINMVIEPEKMKAILKSITDYKVDLIERIAVHIRPDSITLHDDWGMESAPFISLRMWRELIKPCTRRMYDAVKRHGILLIQHTCGNVEPFLEDIVGMGADGWESYQNCNDLAAIKKAFGRRLVFVGAPDVRRYASGPDQSEEAVLKSMRAVTDLLRVDGGYLPDSDIGSFPKYAAALKTVLHEE